MGDNLNHSENSSRIEVINKNLHPQGLFNPDYFQPSKYFSDYKAIFEKQQFSGLDVINFKKNNEKIDISADLKEK